MVLKLQIMKKRKKCSCCAVYPRSSTQPKKDGQARRRECSVLGTGKTYSFVLKSKYKGEEASGMWHEAPQSVCGMQGGSSVLIALELREELRRTIRKMYQ